LISGLTSARTQDVLHRSAQGILPRIDALTRLPAVAAGLLRVAGLEGDEV